LSESTRPDDLNSRSISLNYLIEEAEIPRLSRLCGPLETNIDYLARRLGVGISRRGAQFQVSGQEKPVRTAISVLEKLYAESKRDITHETIHLILQTELEKEPETMSEPRSQLSFEIKPDSEPSAPSLNPSQISQTKNTPSCTKRSVDSRRSSVRAPLSTHFPQLSLASYDEGGHSSKSAG
jgi:phosphate starvation-inducible protein PhoH